MENGEISITQALNQLQSWLNAGNYDKVIQGSQEILEINPGNQRALALMKQAEERRFKSTKTPSPDNDPLANLQVEENSEPAPKPAPEPAPEPEVHIPESDPFEKHKLFLAMLIPAILVVLIGGGVIWKLSNNDREETIEEIITTYEGNYIEDNEERVDVLTDMGKALDLYKSEKGVYPSVNQIESALLSTDYFDEILTDPRSGQFDKSGKVFGYMYAVYDTSAGNNTAYIISALFEDSKGFGYAWTRGASTKNYEDYREINENHVTFIGDDIEIDETNKEENKGPKVKPD